MGETSVHMNGSETDTNLSSNTNNETSNVMQKTTAPSDQSMEQIFDEKGGAAYCGCKPPLMRKWRREGRGPAYLKIGRLVRYRERDLAEFLEQHLIRPEVIR